MATVSFTATDLNQSGWGPQSSPWTSTTNVNVNDNTTEIVFHPVSTFASNVSGHAIKWQPATNTWADASAADYPTYVDGTAVTVFSGTNRPTIQCGIAANNLLFEFQHPEGLPYTSSVNPSTLPALNSSDPWPSTGYEFRWRYSSTGYEHYDIWRTQTSDWWNANQSVQGIKVDTATDTWYDDGPNDPQSLSVSGGVVSVIGGYGGTQTLYTFTKPTTADWLTATPSVTITAINRLTPWTTTVNDGVNPPVSYHLEGEIVTNDTLTSSDVTLAKDFASYANSNLTLYQPSAGKFFGISKPSDGLYHIAVGDKHNDYLHIDSSWRNTITSSSSTRTTNSDRILNVISTIPMNAKIYVRVRKNALPHQTAFGPWSEWQAVGSDRHRFEHKLVYSGSNTDHQG